jgi:hypothetical protein
MKLGAGGLECDKKNNVMAHKLVRTMLSIQICQTFDLLDCVRVGLQTIDLLFA